MSAATRSSLALSLVLSLLVSAREVSAANDTSCSLAGGSLAESTLSPPTGEDEDFLGRSSGGLPYIAFVIDSSSWMRRFPIDLTSAAVRAQGLECGNTVLDTLTYEANPCIDGKGLFVPYAAAGCSASTLQPAGFGAPYASATRYAPYDSDLPNLFKSDRFYVFDRGWGTKSDDVQSSWVKSTAMEACAAAGVESAAQSNCSSCVGSRGYYLPTDQAIPPVLAGNWINFNPPKYVIARKLLKDQFAALDAPSRTRQTMLTVVADAAERCFSRNLGGAGMDPPRDGATLLGPQTQFKPPCGQFAACVHNGSNGGGRAAFDNKVNKSSELFTSPSATCPAGLELPSEAPSAATRVTFAKTADTVCRGAYVDAAGTVLGEAACAPYAEAVLNAGQYLGDLRLYDEVFTATPAGTWRKSQLDDDDGVCPAASCGCPRPSIILLAGGAPGFDDNLPCEVTGRGCAEFAPVDACRANASPSASSNLAKTTRFLASFDLKPTENYNSPARVSTHVVAFGTDHPDLVEAARAGQGRFFSATTAQQLRSAINEAIAAASTQQFSFSNASLSTVQTRSTSGLLVPRFTPSQTSAFWSGKLFQFKTINEDVCGCSEPVAVGDPCDFNADRQCGGVFFQDADGDFIASDANGVFRKARLIAGEFRPGVKEASPIWEANEALTRRSAARRVLTVIDSNSDGALDHRDEVISFDETNASALLPYLNVGTDAFCVELGSRLGTCLSPEHCATRVIQYVRGLDVLDEDCDGDRLEERANKLGDIFHSSPIIVDPPLSTRSAVCQLGLNSQCLVSLTSTPTPQNPETAYEDYVRTKLHRDKIVLVGANDGMLHAFRGGRWIAADNPDTDSFDECPGPTNCTGYYDLGDGEELWAFIPPDLLPKLSKLMLERHQYFVDGTAMVRDVWADANGNATKEADEFHTVAVVGERRGGTHFFALDVTRPEGPVSLPSKGFFRWIYPQPNTVEARGAGQSFTEFLPSPPPIAPVRVHKGTGPRTGVWQGAPYEERWIVMLNGGFDPGQLRGRSIHMVDVWRGGDGISATRALWTFDSGTEGHSFAATPGMVGFGLSAQNPNRDPNDYFMDTATVGDVGGQLWTLRFNHPDPTKWAGGRMFQSSAAGGTCARQPIFQITSNVVATQGGHLRTLVGTGDRFNIAQRGGGECSLNNLVGCLRRGCTLTQEVTRTVCGRTSRFQRAYGGANGADVCELPPDVLTLDPASGTACCSSPIDVRADYRLACTNRDGSPVAIRWQPTVTCQATSASVCGSAESAFVCEATHDTPFDLCGTFDRCKDPIVPPPNGFYSVRVFDEATRGRSVFDDPSAAVDYDGAVLTTANLIQVDPYTPSTAQARASDDGWFLSYGKPNPPGHAFPQTPARFDGSAVDERTTTAAVVIGGCSIFTTTTPGSGSGACQPRAMVTNTSYYLNFLSGGVCGGLDAALASRLDHRQASEPPSPAQVTMDVTPHGTINLKLAGISRSTGGAAQITPLVDGFELVKVGYRLPVTRPLHACRHPPGASAADQRANAAQSCEVR